MTQEKFAIRFGLGAIKAVGFGMMENAVLERKRGGDFKDIYDFSERLDPRSINKKSIEALAKAGAFDVFARNRRQIAESFDILSAYAVKKQEDKLSNQMSLFGGMPEANAKPELKKVPDFSKAERLQKEFEAFGFFLNEHPLDDNISELKKRGVIFSSKVEGDELLDGNLVKMAGVVASSKHRSSARGRFAYLTISDPFGIYEAMIFDEALITAARDILVDGSMIALECLIRKDEGGVRILVRDIKKLDDFIKSTKAQEKDFEDIKMQPQRRNYQRNDEKPRDSKVQNVAPVIEKKVLARVEIILKTRDAVFNLKVLLAQRLAPVDAVKVSKVFLVVMEGGKVVKLELPKNYFLDASDVARLKAVGGVMDVEVG